jgi:hypothetical protein
MTTEPSDALTVARFCWPENTWHATESYWCPHVARRIPALRSSRFEADNRSHVAEAERILIERGHGAAYGRALWEELRSSLPDRVRAPELKEDQWEQMAAIATAPRAVRLRAMAETIRNLKPKETDK